MTRDRAHECAAPIVIATIALACRGLAPPERRGRPPTSSASRPTRLPRGLRRGRGTPTRCRVAQRLVALTEEQYGAEDRQLVNPLTNLGTVYYRLGDYPNAETSYLRAVRLIEGKLAGADRMLMRPLLGLGETYLATRQHAEGATALKRAVDLSRNLDGLFNVEQLDILDPLVECYVALDRLGDAEKENQYAFRVAESAYGRNDLRMLEPLDRLARWYEFVGRYTTRAACTPARCRSPRSRGPRHAAVGGGAARPGAQLLPRIHLRTRGSGAAAGPVRDQQRDAADGADREPAEPRRGTRAALRARGAREGRAAGPARARRDAGRARRLVPDRRRPRARQTRPIALAGRNWTPPETMPWHCLPRRAASPTARPRRRSPARGRTIRGSFEERFVEARFKVLADGKVVDVESVGTDAPTAIEKATLFAVRKARYAPRIENGEPVATEGVTLRERVLVKAPQVPATPEPR